MTATNAELQRHEPQQLLQTQFSPGDPAPWPPYRPIGQCWEIPARIRMIWTDSSCIPVQNGPLGLGCRDNVCNVPHEFFLTWFKASFGIADRDERPRYGNMCQNYRLKCIVVVAR